MHCDRNGTRLLFVLISHFLYTLGESQCDLYFPFLFRMRSHRAKLNPFSVALQYLVRLSKYWHGTAVVSVRPFACDVRLHWRSRWWVRLANCLFEQFNYCDNRWRSIIFFRLQSITMFGIVHFWPRGQRSRRNKPISGSRNQFAEFVISAVESLIKMHI